MPPADSKKELQIYWNPKSKHLSISLLHQKTPGSAPLERSRNLFNNYTDAINIHKVKAFLESA